MKDEEILSESKKRFQSIMTAEKEIRESALEDIRFAYNVDGGQWEEYVRVGRQNDKRPCLTFNKLRKFIAQVANKEREARMSVKVVPVDDKADPETAKILTDLIRQIEYNSIADEVYAKAGEQAIAGGFGYWRVLTAYAEDSFDQDISIEAIENPFAVYYDPRGQYCFIREGMTVAEFKKAYPKAEQSDFTFSGRGEEYALWYEENKLFVAEYFVKEPTEKKLVEVVKIEVDPLTGTSSPVGESQIFELDTDITADELKAAGFEILKTRTVKTYKIMWYKITGAEVLDKQEWPGKYIPVVEVVGDEINIAGKTYKRSLIRDGKDAQRMYNYWATSMTEKVALTPKAPFLVTPREIQGFETMWDEANIKNYPYLLYNPESQRVPQRQTPTQVEAGAMSMLGIADKDIKDTVGMYEPTVGDVSNERSGKAIQVRNLRSEMGVFHFPDNLRRAILQTGRILIDLIPKIYDSQRIIRIRNYEGEEQIGKINYPVTDLQTGEQVIMNDLTVGKYDIRADVGTYSTRRQETVETMMQAMQYAPAVAPAIVPLLFKYMDAPGADEIVKAIQDYLTRLSSNGTAKSPIPALPGVAEGLTPTTPTGGA